MSIGGMSMVYGDLIILELLGFCIMNGSVEIGLSCWLMVSKTSMENFSMGPQISPTQVLYLGINCYT